MQKLAEDAGMMPFMKQDILWKVSCSATSGEDTVAAGKNVIRDQIGDLTFEISPASFYQVNPVQTERLYDKVREHAVFLQRRMPGILRQCRRLCRRTGKSL